MNEAQRYEEIFGLLTLYARQFHLARLLSRARMVDKTEELIQAGQLEEAYVLAKELSEYSDGFAQEGRLLQIRILDALISERTKQERYADCLHYLEEWSQLAPNDLYPLLRRAEILQHEMGQLEEAVALLFRIVKRAPRCLEAWIQLAFTALSIVMAPAWRATSGPNRPTSHLPCRISDAVRFATHAWRAMRSPQWAYTPYPEVVEVIVGILYEVSARALLLCGLHDKALNVLHGAQEIVTYSFRLQRPEALTQPAVTALKVRAPRMCYRLVELIDHDLVRSVIDAATCCDNAEDLIGRGNYQQALDTLQQCGMPAKLLLRHRFHQLQVEALSLLAEEQRSSGDLLAELQSIEQWLRMEPTNLFARFRLGEILSYQGELSAARVALQKLLRVHPHCVDAWTELSIIDTRCRRPTRALQRLLKAWDSLQSAQWAYYPSEPVVRVGLESLVCQTALILGRFRKYEDALEVMRQAKRQLGTSEQIDKMIKQVEDVLA